MKHVVFDVRALSPHRDGISTYIAATVPAVLERLTSHRVTLLTSPRTTAVAAGWGAEVLEVRARAMWPGQNLTIPRVLRRLAPDVYFYPAHDPPVAGVPCPLVITVHDLTPLALRPYFESFDALKRGYLRAVTGRAVARADAIVVPSKATKDVIASIFGPAAGGKTRVAWYGPTAAPVRAGRPSHLLYLGTDRPHKNVLRLVDAYGLARRQHRDLPPLVLAGGFRAPDVVRRRIAAAGVTQEITVTGHVTDARAETLLADAVALLMPSLAEGFGFPIVDAMASGIPVLTSDRSSCAEVAGDAARLVDPEDTGAIARAIGDLALDDGLRDDLRARGLARASSFRWSDAAEAVATAILDALETRR